MIPNFIIIGVIEAKRSKPVEPIPEWEYLTVVGGIVILVLLGGLVAGLTIGLMSLDPTNLAILKVSGSPSEKKAVKKIEPLRKNGHLLLVTLLLVNTVVNETLPILFDAIHFNGYKAVLFSTVLIVLFGEIIPQAVCARYGLQIGAFFVWPVKILILCFYLISKPIAALLDYILGHKDGNIYRHAGLKELVAIHGEDNEGPLSMDEVSILRAVLDLKTKTVLDIMTSLENVFMLPLSQSLNRETVKSIVNAGFSRIPIYLDERKHVLGCVLTKTLILNDPDDSTPVSALKLRKLPKVRFDTPLFEMLHIFEAGSSHMALVVREVDEKSVDDTVVGEIIVTSMAEWSLKKPQVSHRTEHQIIGIVTMEDVMEELIGHEIIDETDVYVDIAAGTRVQRIASEEFENNEALPILQNPVNSNSALFYRSINIPESRLFEKGKVNQQNLSPKNTQSSIGRLKNLMEKKQSKKQFFPALELADKYERKRAISVNTSFKSISDSNFNSQSL